jgi:hypothetical protein
MNDPHSNFHFGTVNFQFQINKKINNFVSNCVSNCMNGFTMFKMSFSSWDEVQLRSTATIGVCNAPRCRVRWTVYGLNKKNIELFGTLGRLDARKKLIFAPFPISRFHTKNKFMHEKKVFYSR